MDPIEVKSGMYSLTDSGMVDNSTAEPIYRRYDPDVPVTNANNNININVRDMSEYYSLSDSFLEIELQYSAGGVGAGGADDPNPLNGGVLRPCHMAGGVASCFNTSRLRLNNVLVEDNQYSLHNSFVKVLTTKSKQWLETCGKAQGIVLDTSQGNIATKHGAANDITRIAEFNEGLLQRAELVGDNALFAAPLTRDFAHVDPAARPQQAFTLPLSDLFSFCTVNKVLKGAPIRIELIKNSGVLNSFGTTANAEVRVVKCVLWLKIVRPSLPVLGELESMFASEAVVPWNYPRWNVYSSDANREDNRRYTFSTLSQKPHTAFLMCHTADANGGSQENHLRYDHLSMTQAKIKINGKQYPYSGYDMVWTSGERSVARAYQELVKFAGRDEDTTDGFAITPQTFVSNYPVLHFDLADVEPSSGGYQVQVELNHGVPARATTIYLVVVSEAKTQVQLSNRNVLVYTN